LSRDVANGPQVRFVTKRWPHHSTHSGYDRLTHYIGSAIDPIDLGRLSSRWIPERVAVRFTRRAGVYQYFLPSFYAEWAAAREMIVRPGKAIYHVLYGDDTYRYLGNVRRLRGHRLVVSYHVPPDNLRSRLSNTGHLAQVDAVVVVGTNQLPFFVELCGEDRVHYVPHGIDTDVFYPSETSAGSSGNKPQVVFVGSHRRDFAVLRQVIERVGRLAPDATFVLLTDTEVGSAFRSYRNVTLPSRVSEAELITLYRESALLLQPMEESTANNSILEAMACGTPVVATDVGGVGAYVGEGSAVLTKPGDADTMADAVLDIVGDRSIRERMGQAARLKAEEFAWPKIVAQMTDIYRSIL
jgi:glycosyltransferase involved in cell wall biosynthesis